MRWLRTILLLSSVLLTSCTLFQKSPEPCHCSVAEQELRAYTLKYFDALEDAGNLRQALKACDERH